MLANNTSDAHLPTMLPVLPGLALSGRYLLTGDEPVNRGDTLGATPLPDDRVALMVADVVGHGDSAALASAQARSVLWAQLADGASLSSAMESLDRFASRDVSLNAAAVTVAVLDLDDGRLEYAAAGMRAPILAAAGEAPRVLDARPTRPLGTGGVMHVQTADLEVDDSLVMCTNGLCCGPANAGGDVTEALLSIVGGVVDGADDGLAPADAADLMTRELMSHCLPVDGPGDDVALLVARRAPVPESLSLELTAAMPELVGLRSTLDGWLDLVGAGLVDHIGLGHALVELAANAVEHAYPPELPTDQRAVDVHVVLDPSGGLRATVSDKGTWRLPEDPHGRGLTVAGGLMESIDVRRNGHGTDVEVRTRLGRPVQLWTTDEGVGTPERSDDFHVLATLGSITASGCIDQVAAEEFHAAMHDATRAGTSSSVVDLNGVSHLSSPCVQTLLEFSERVLDSGAELELVADPGTPARQVLDVVGLAPIA